MSADAVIRVDGIHKAYGRVVAVDDVSFEVDRGEIFGLIGPNGAGKTTTMECVEGLRRPDRGRIEVLGFDLVRDARALYERVGVQLQLAQLQKRITVWEAVDFWASLYRRPVDDRALLERLGLADKRRAWFMTLSGGQRQRLFIALALIHDPEVVMFDELTTGLDPQARRAIWEMVRGIRERGKTVLLTTHLMEEAERLCDRVAIVERGRVIDAGPPAALVARHCPEQTVVLMLEPGTPVDPLARLAATLAIDPADGRVRIRGNGPGLVAAVIECLSQHRIGVTDFRTELPTLEDVCLKLTGYSIRE